MVEDLNGGFERLFAYFNGARSGNFFVANAENYDAHDAVLHRLRAVGNRRIVFVSDHLFANGLPDVDAAIKEVTGAGDYVLAGLSQALMLRSVEALEDSLRELLERTIKGRCVVLLDHCGALLRALVERDKRLDHRVLLIDGAYSRLPRIRLARDEAECRGVHSLKGLGGFLKFMSGATDDRIERQPIVTVLTRLSKKAFRDAVYSIESTDAFENLPDDLKRSVRKTFGTEEQWRRLSQRLGDYKSFAESIRAEFGSTTSLSMQLSKVIRSNDEDAPWRLWLALKVFGEPGNKYLTRAAEASESWSELIERLYFDLIEIDADDPNFDRFYDERKVLLERLPENLSLTQKYCARLERRCSKKIFYLTDVSERERLEFMKCLNASEYGDGELRRALEKMSARLSLYMREFVFDRRNTPLAEADADFASELTSYFREYKRQKLRNRLDENFLRRVEQYARSRPYNKLQPRSALVSHLDRKDKALFFVDALGVEYLSFITAECAEYDLSAEIFVGRCELPSITECNKEFLSHFDAVHSYKIDALDEIKHRSLKFDYRKCRLPIHLFTELEAIDDALRSIRSKLFNGDFDGAILTSDHGASRLAVLYGHESNSAISLDEAGRHGGRCCPSEHDPELASVAYENGWAILADYDRFKGGRRAEVEVHGGASLEEVLVPVIVLKA